MFMSHLFRLRTGSTLTAATGPGQCLLPLAPCASPFPVLSQVSLTQWRLCLSWWGPHIWQTCFGWMCERNAVFVNLEATATRLPPSLGKISVREARLLSMFQLVSPSQPLLSPFRVSPNPGGCSFLSAIKSNFGCYFHYCEVAHAYDLSIRKTNGRRDSHPLILLAPKTAMATVEEPPRSLSRL